MMWNRSLRAVDLDDDLTGVRCDLLRRIEHEVGGADERLGKKRRVVDDHHPREVVLVPDQMFCDGREIAPWNAVAANPSRLQMGGSDRQYVAVPLTRREALPGVSRPLRRMRTA